MEDTEFSAGTMNGQKFESGKFSGTLRRKLMREHLGIEPNDQISVSDPVSDTFW